MSDLKKIQISSRQNSNAHIIESYWCITMVLDLRNQHNFCLVSFLTLRLACRLRNRDLIFALSALVIRRSSIFALLPKGNGGDRRMPAINHQTDPNRTKLSKCYHWKNHAKYCQINFVQRSWNVINLHIDACILTYRGHTCPSTLQAASSQQRTTDSKGCPQTFPKHVQIIMGVRCMSIQRDRPKLKTCMTSGMPRSRSNWTMKGCLYPQDWLGCSKQ